MPSLEYFKLSIPWPALKIAGGNFVLGQQVVPSGLAAQAVGLYWIPEAKGVLAISAEHDHVCEITCQLVGCGR